MDIYLGFAGSQSRGSVTGSKEYESGPFKTKNNAQTLPKQPQNKFEKVQKTTLNFD